MNEFAERIKDNIIEHEMISKDDRVLVSLSGGPDSTALLDILHILSNKMKFTLTACYINHNIRPKAVAKEIDSCANLCSDRNIDLIVIDVDIPAYAKKEKLSLEEAGHKFRKKALAEIAQQEKCQRIATGHHFDDQVETILFRLIRGTGPAGIYPIRPVSGNLIRPLYNISREDIELYIKTHDLNPVIDKSNLESKYSRNYIRNKIIPIIEKRFSGFRNSLVKFSEIIASENDFINQIAAKEIKKLHTVTPGGKFLVDLKRLSGYDQALIRRFIKSLIESYTGINGAGSFEEIARVEEILEGSLKATELATGIKVVSDRERLYFLKKKVYIREKELITGKITDIPEINCRIKCKMISVSNAVKALQKKGKRIYIDIDSLKLPLYIRGVKKGDSFSPLGMKGIKKVGDFLTDKKISKYVRDEIPVIIDGKGIVWLAGHQIADRVKIKSNTSQVMEIDLIEKRT